MCSGWCVVCDGRCMQHCTTALYCSTAVQLGMPRLAHTSPVSRLLGVDQVPGTQQSPAITSGYRSELELEPSPFSWLKELTNLSQCYVKL